MYRTRGPITIWLHRTRYFGGPRNFVDYVLVYIRNGLFYRISYCISLSRPLCIYVGPSYIYKLSSLYLSLLMDGDESDVYIDHTYAKEASRRRNKRKKTGGFEKVTYETHYS